MPVSTGGDSIKPIDNHLFNLMAGLSQDVVILFDRVGAIRYANAAFEKAAGYRLSDSLGQTPAALPGFPGADFLMTQVQRVVNSGRAVLARRGTGTESGDHPWEVTHFLPLHDETGEIILVLSVNRDLSGHPDVRGKCDLLEDALDRCADAVFALSAAMKILYVNDAACSSLGYSRHELLSMTMSDVVGVTNPPDPDYRTPGTDERRFGAVHQRRDGSTFPVQVVSGADRSGRNRVYVARDDGPRMLAEREIALWRGRYRNLIERWPDMVVRYDRAGRRTFVNATFAATWGREIRDLIGQRPSDIPGGGEAALVERRISDVFATGKPIGFETRWEAPAGRYILGRATLIPERDMAGRISAVLGIYRDITEISEYRQRLHELASTDSLTGLPNRALLADRLGQAIADATWHGRVVAVMMIDLDRFKTVNDTLGLGVGDRLLREVAVRLSAAVRGYDTVTRLGGDEFVILMPDIRDCGDLGRLAGKLLRAINDPVHLDGKEIVVTASIGIAVYPNDGIDANDLLKNADAAMFQAKRSGRNEFRFYTPELTVVAARNLKIENGLRRALEKGELQVLFQPKVEMGSGRVTGSEALLRWTSPDLGAIPPQEFIPVAEDTGMIGEIGAWVLREACHAACDWNLPGAGRSHRIAVNLSGRQFRDRTLIQTIRGILDETGCRPDWIELEITESLLLDMDDPIQEMLLALRRMGITIAVDDFGTGYSSFSYLADYAIDTLKIDRSFIVAATSDRRRAEVVKAIIAMAGRLGQQVVAEGVETAEQAAFLTDNGCHLAQGWYYSHPLPKTGIDALLRRSLPLPHV
ncbi:MAG: EAL domain-containing protein [Telmatospirillum sp.]|nr:EAL domain-containing protein [Telmatospirillum sp.]